MLKTIIETTEYTPCFFYESVHRIEKFLDELEGLGYVGKVFIAREISKMFEEKIMGTASELKEKIKNKQLVIK